jgi:hypothetical protein|tara:strand:+ start:170 stop:451 length:282 start_codon:yes stop_codon:yes gene_type:complete
MGHFEEVHALDEVESLEQANRKKRYGLREYSSENGPLVHRTVNGTEERHFDLKVTGFRQIKTPSEKAAIEAEMKDVESLKIDEVHGLEGADLG